MKLITCWTLFSLPTGQTVVYRMPLVHYCIILTNILTNLMYVRTLFIDFLLAFNTIKPHILLSKLLNMNINSHLVLWIADFFNFRPQRVRFANTFSDITHISTGVPQGCVLSPLLFSMYTSDFQLDNNQCVLTKYADDTALTGLITNNDEVGYRNEITKFLIWCENNMYLVLNVKKT